MLSLAQVQCIMIEQQDPFLQQGPPPCPPQLDGRVIGPLGRAGGRAPEEFAEGRAAGKAPVDLECHLAVAGRVAGRVSPQAEKRYALLQELEPQGGPGVSWVGGAAQL